jgi:hypothetical protein
VIEDPIRPRALWYWIGALLIVAGVVGAVAWFVLGLMSLDETVDDFERVALPGGGSVTLDDAGEYVVYAEASGTTPLRPSGITVTGPDGEPVATEVYSGSVTYGFGGRSGIAVSTFSADEPGQYVVETTSALSAGAETLAVGPSIGGDLLGAILGGFAIGAIGVLTGVVVLIVTGVRRGRAKRARRPPTPPPSSWGQAPPTWGSPPQAGVPGWGQPPPPGSPPPPPPSSPPPPRGWPR